MVNEVFLIVEPLGLVAEDLAQCIAEHRAGARVVVAPDADAALRTHDDAPRISAAIVHVDPEGFSQTPLGAWLNSVGARVAFLGDAAERWMAGDAGPPCGGGTGIVVLDRPFSPASVGALLDRLQRPDVPLST